MPFKSKKADDSSRLFNRAADLHRKGNLSVAERLYLKILKARPDQFEVLHLLGILRHQQGRFTEALTSYDKALRIKPRSADTLSNRGSTLRVLNRPAEGPRGRRLRRRGDGGPSPSP